MLKSGDSTLRAESPLIFLEKSRRGKSKRLSLPSSSDISRKIEWVSVRRVGDIASLNVLTTVDNFGFFGHFSFHFTGVSYSLCKIMVFSIKRYASVIQI